MADKIQYGHQHVKIFAIGIKSKEICPIVGF